MTSTTMYFVNFRDADDDYRCLGTFTNLRDASASYHDYISTNTANDVEYYITDNDGVMYGSHSFLSE